MKTKQMHLSHQFKTDICELPINKWYKGKYIYWSEIGDMLERTRLLLKSVDSMPILA
jgi:hypothetical protein